MSDRDSTLYLRDIIESGEAISEYVTGMVFADFEKDRKTVSATIREFEVIGEAVSKLPESMKALKPDIRWQDIKDFRNILIHEYFGVDRDLVWNVIQEDLPLLLAGVKQLLDEA